MRDHASIPRFASSQQREVNKRVSCGEDHELLAATRELDLHGICRLWDQGPGETWGCPPRSSGDLPQSRDRLQPRGDAGYADCPCQEAGRRRQMSRRGGQGQLPTRPTPAS